MVNIELTSAYVVISALGLVIMGLALYLTNQRLKALQNGMQGALIDLRREGQQLFNQVVEEKAKVASKVGQMTRLFRTAKAQGIKVEGLEAGEEIEVPDWLVNVAKGAGIDVGAVLAGDPEEMEKAKRALDAISSDVKGGAAKEEIVYA